MSKKTRTLAIGGIATALTFVLCWFASISMSAKFILPGLCGIFLMVLARQTSGKTAWCVFCASSLLLLLLPNRISAFAYILLLGYYPLLSQCLEKLSWLLRLVIKLLLLTAVGCITLFVGAGAMGLWENEKFLQYYPYMILAYYLMAGIYDGFLRLLRWKFSQNWDAKMQKLLKLR